MLVGEPDRAVKLDTGLGNSDGVFRRLGFRGGGHRRIDAKDLVVGRDLVHQRTRRLDPDVDVRCLVLQRLENADQLAELLSDAQVVERHLLRLFHDTEHLGGQRRSARL